MKKTRCRTCKKIRREEEEWRKYCSYKCKKKYEQNLLKDDKLENIIYLNRKCLICGKVGDWYCRVHREMKDRITSQCYDISVDIDPVILANIS